MTAFQNLVTLPSGATLVRITAPIKIIDGQGGTWKCARCGSKYGTDTAARTCAEGDHTGGGRA